MPDDKRRLAEAMRAACLKAAQDAYESAAVSGLCEEGAITTIDLDAVIARLSPGADTT